MVKKITTSVELKGSWSQYFKDLTKHEYKKLRKLKDPKNIDYLLGPFLKNKEPSKIKAEREIKKFTTSDLTPYTVKSEVDIKFADSDTTQEYSYIVNKPVFFGRIPSVFDDELVLPKNNGLNLKALG